MRRNGYITLIVILLGLAPSRMHADELVVVVHPTRVATLELADIVQIYLKQRRFWSDGGTIVPVNREAGSLARETFAKAIFDAESHSLSTYWNREYFRGVLPPITLASAEAVRRYVASEPRAIGYIPLELVDETVHLVFRLKN